VQLGALQGAMEPYVMTEQSPEVRANKNQLLDDAFARPSPRSPPIVAAPATA
jgi:hypothetical protein